MNNEDIADIIKKNLQELRRGNLVITVLAMLPERKYGYELLKEINEAGFSISGDTLYPLLRRLEEQTLVDSEWIIDTSRPRKYYRINKNGKVLLDSLKEEWFEQHKRIKEVLNESNSKS